MSTDPAHNSAAELPALDPYRAATELRDQLGSGKRRLGFFFGAGTSMAAGLPGITTLTDTVLSVVQNEHKETLDELLLHLPDEPNIEDILSRIRLCRELIGESTDTEIQGIAGKDAGRALDAAVCAAISRAVSADSPNLKPYVVLAQWLRELHGDRPVPVEVFTLNYDLLLERALDQTGTPYFDGFVGVVEPFFAPEAIAAKNRTDGFLPPRSWTRVWKLHGSLGWRLRPHPATGIPRAIRLVAGDASATDEVMIFPSRDKYSESRKLPFLALQDRLRDFLSDGETLLVVCGYSFSDQHINEILLNALQSNGRLAITCLGYGSLAEHVRKFAEANRNLSVYAATEAVVGGVRFKWQEPASPDDETAMFWDANEAEFALGNFSAFADFLERFIRFRALATLLDPSPADTANTAVDD